MRTTRLFLILDALRVATSPVQARTLALDLEVSERTIYRDMATLQAIGAPVRGEAGIGYQLEPGFFLPSLHFDVDEMDALRFGLRLVSAKGDSSLREAAERAAGKIAAVLDGPTGRDFLDLPFLAVSRIAGRARDDGDMLVDLRGAIRRRAVLRIAYADLNDRDSERTCRPLGLTIFDDAWLLTIWCELRGDFRNLRVDRIRSIAATGQVFRHEPGKRLADYLRSLTRKG
jgi:predicted DNA-binding transcriptional regulator YafY